MKALKMRIQKSSRWGVILLAAVVAILTCMTVANATQTITTPNAVKITYNLAAGANSAAITPAANTSVLVMGCCTNSGADSVGQVTLLVSTAGSDMDWAGVESQSNSPSTITSGFASAAGTHIVWIDFNHTVDIQSASSHTILIHNADVVTNAGNVTLIW
jgi:hypothetical protein